MWNSALQLLDIFDKQSRIRLMLLMLPMAATTVLELFSIALILPVIQVTVLGDINHGLTTKFLDLLPQLDIQSLGYWVALIFGGIFLLKNIFLLVTIYIVNITMDYMGAIYTKKLFEIYLRRPLVFHYNNNSGLLLRNLTSGINNTMGGAKLIMIMVFDTMVMVAAILFLAIIEPEVTFAGGSFLAILALVYYKIFSPIFKNWGEKSMILEGGRNKWMLQSLSGIRDVKVTNSYYYLLSKVYKICRDHAKFYSLSATGIHVPRLLIESSVVAGFLLVVFLMTSVGQEKGEIVTLIGLFGMAAFRIMPSLNRVLVSASDIRKVDSYIKMTHEAFTTITKNDLFQNNKEQLEEFSFSNELELDNISYAYPDSKTPALSGLSFSIKKGQLIGIVGASGAGKSTLMDIILGLLQPDHGRFLVDGKDITRNIERWQEKCGFVPQDIFLLDDTIRRNIAFSLEDSDIKHPQVEKAIEMAGLGLLINELPDGLDTTLGENGAKLSGGQKQRLVIARAFYRDPELFLFDEPTSALDNITENEVRETLANLHGNKTVIIIAHRLSTVKNCDKLIFIKNGELIAVDKYDKLLAENEQFRELVLAGDKLG